LLDRKLITTAGRKQVIGRPILYKTTKEFLMRFGLKDVNELPSMEEFEKLVAESFQGELLPAEEAAGEAREQQADSSSVSETAEVAAQKE
jgi:segregation and condensation protein B